MWPGHVRRETQESGQDDERETESEAEAERVIWRRGVRFTQCTIVLAAALEGVRAACVRVGAALASLGLAASSTVRHVWQLCLTYGVLVGAGHSLGNFTPILILPKWFDKRFARATFSRTRQL